MASSLSYVAAILFLVLHAFNFGNALIENRFTV